MAQPNHTPRLAYTEEALTVLFCLIDDAYAHLNPRARCYESIKRLSDSEVIALALFQQSCQAWKANALCCGMPSGSSRTCLRG
jgi:hypothetical protein